MEDPRDEELIAYLDGELEPSDSRQIEERLKHDPKLRRELALYERSWDMLDRLERSTVGEAFTRSTLQMISLAASQDPPPARTWRRPNWRQLGILLAAVVVALAIGYAGGRAIWPDPNRQLLEDLPILEDLGMYEQAGSIEFLRKLSRADHTFHGDVDAAKMPGLAVPDSHDERRDEITRMPAAEREHLLHRRNRFADYSENRKQELRALHESLNHDSDGVDMRNVLVHYHEWLDTVSPSVRKELEDLSDDADARIARIEQIQQARVAQHKEQRKDGPGDQDLVAILAWLDDFAWQHRQELLGTLSDKRRQYIGRLDEKNQRRALVWMMQHSGGPAGPTVRPEQADFERLAERLSPEARARLEHPPPGQNPGKLTHHWVEIAQIHQADTVGLVRMLPPIGLEELQRFAAQELSEEQRDAVMPMSRMRKYRVRLGLYFLPVDRLAKITPEEIRNGFPLRPQHRPPDGAHPDGPPPPDGPRP